MTDIPWIKRAKIPYRVVEHVPTGRGAAYSRNIAELLVDQASERLMRFARERHTLKRDFDAEISRLPLPSWLTPDMLGDCVLYWLRNGASTDEHVLATPRR